MVSTTACDRRASPWSFATDRFEIVPWRSCGDDALIAFLCSALNTEVTRELPESWQVALTPKVAPAWIAERDAEGLMFLVLAGGEEPVGFFMFFPGDATGTDGEVRIGYVLARASWGKGYATEIVRGFLRRWEQRGCTASLVAGVTRDNVASQRVLEKAGFHRSAAVDDILEYRLQRRD